MHLIQVVRFWKYEYLKTNISTDKRGIDKYNSQYFITNPVYTTSKEGHYLGISSFGELIIDRCYSGFDQGCEVLEMGIF